MLYTYGEEPVQSSLRGSGARLHQFLGSVPHTFFVELLITTQELHQPFLIWVCPFQLGIGDLNYLLI